MLYIVISLLASVSVGILLKYSKQQGVNTMQMINWNYFYALILGYILFQPNYAEVAIAQVPWGLLIAFWLILPSLFFIQALSLKHVGVAKTDVAQRLSLFITLLFAGLYFHEDFNSYKIIGSIIALGAICMTLYKKGSGFRVSKNLFYPVVVLFGFALVDIMFKITATYQAMSFTSLLVAVFAGSLVVASLINFYLMVAKQQGVNFAAGIWGAVLGILNFSNIYFYIKAHQALQENPSVVFATMNIGVVVLGCLAGVWLFNEKLHKLNYLGIFLALLAVTIITLNLLVVA